MTELINKILLLIATVEPLILLFLLAVAAFGVIGFALYALTLALKLQDRN